jgi:hypothetical protein
MSGPQRAGARALHRRRRQQPAIAARHHPRRALRSHPRPACVCRRREPLADRRAAGDAVFINAGKPLRGRPPIAGHRCRAEAKAPLTSRPEIAQVAASGELGSADGLVLLQDRTASARFASMWRPSGAGPRTVMFDNGCGLGAGAKA